MFLRYSSSSGLRRSLKAIVAFNSKFLDSSVQYSMKYKDGKKGRERDLNFNHVSFNEKCRRCWSIVI